MKQNLWEKITEEYKDIIPLYSGPIREGAYNVTYGQNEKIITNAFWLNKTTLKQILKTKTIDLKELVVSPPEIPTISPVIKLEWRH